MVTTDMAHSHSHKHTHTLFAHLQALYKMHTFIHLELFKELCVYVCECVHL